MALLLAGHNPQLQLLGVSTVAGNQTADKVTKNALSALYVGGIHADVVKGQDKPILQCSALLCPEIHGESGLDGPDGGCLLPPSPQQPLPGKAPIVMFERIAAHHKQTGEKVVLICTGALTNAALLLTLYPELVSEGMMELVLMGGALGLGNTGPVMEFNIQTDPEAARIVFESGVPLTMVPLEVTHTALVTTRVLQDIRLAHGSTPFKELVTLLLLFFATTYREVFKFDDPPLHDPCAVAYVIAPQLFRVEHLRVDIETCSPLSAGQTVVDIWGQSKRPKNCCVAMSMDVAGFWELMLRAVDAADSMSPLNNPAPDQQHQTSGLPPGAAAQQQAAAGAAAVKLHEHGD